MSDHGVMPIEFDFGLWLVTARKQSNHYVRLIITDTAVVQLDKKKHRSVTLYSTTDGFISI